MMGNVFASQLNDDDRSSQVTESDYLDAVSALMPVLDFVSNGLFSDAVKSIKSRKDSLLLLPGILERLYNHHLNNQAVSSSSNRRNDCLKYGLTDTVPIKSDFSNSLVKSVRDNLITLKTDYTTYPKEETDSSLTNIARHYYTDSMPEHFETLQLNKTNCSLKKIIYFKEYSYPVYFNTFLKNLYEIMDTTVKTRLVVFESLGNKLSLKRYGDSFSTCIGSQRDYCCDLHSDKLVVIDASKHMLEQLCLDNHEYGYMIIYDKCGLDNDRVSGLNVHKFSLAKSRSDISLFKLDPLNTISSGIDGIALNLSEIERFNAVSNESIRRKLYKNRFVNQFLQLLE